MTTIFVDAIDSLPSSCEEKAFNARRAESRIRAWLKPAIKARGMRLESVEVNDNVMPASGHLRISAPFDLLGVPEANRVNDDALLAHIEADPETSSAFDSAVWSALDGIIHFEDPYYHGWSFGAEVYDPEHHSLKLSDRLQLEFSFEL